MGAKRKNERKRLPHVHRQGSIATRAAQHRFPARDDPYDRIVYVPNNRPVMNQVKVGDPLESLQRLEFVNANRLVPNVPARSNNRRANLPHQKMMQWRVRKHDSEAAVGRSNGLSQLVRSASPL